MPALAENIQRGEKGKETGPWGIFIFRGGCCRFCTDGKIGSGDEQRTCGLLPPNNQRLLDV